MKNFDVRWQAVSENSVMIYLADEIDVRLAPLLGRVCRAIQKHFPEVIEVTPSYTSILVETGSFAKELSDFGAELLGLVREVIKEDSGALAGKCIELPVYYDAEVGRDLLGLAERAGLGLEEVIEIHSGREYTVCAIGFAPGFAFLAEVDERIAVPRHETPRSHVPAGSVGIAGKQTAVYPAATPGGWQLIGNCPEVLYDPAQSPPCRFEVGDRVRFMPIDRAAFLERGGRV